jgi:hypothetical protein
MLYTPERGCILIDGIDITLLDPSWLRRQIGVVLQENVLFNRSIRDNIALADPTMPMEKVMRPDEGHQDIPRRTALGAPCAPQGTDIQRGCDARTWPYGVCGAAMDIMPTSGLCRPGAGCRLRRR